MMEMEQERKRIMEEDKLLQSKIATLRRELQQFLVTIGDVNLVTSENRGGLNPLRKLLPVQLFMRGKGGCTYTLSILCNINCSLLTILNPIHRRHALLALGQDAVWMPRQSANMYSDCIIGRFGLSTCRLAYNKDSPLDVQTLYLDRPRALDKTC
jgi:hypothetical protein